MLAVPGGVLLTSVAFNPHDQTILTGGTDALARVWDLRNPVDYQFPTLLTLADHLGPIETVGFDGLGDEAISASTDGTARIWDPQPREQREIIRGAANPFSLAFDPADPSRIVTLGANSEVATVQLWDLGRPSRRLATIDIPSQAWTLASAAFSGDGRLLLTTGGTEQARIYSLAGITRPGARLREVGVIDGKSCAAPGGTSTPGFNSAIFSAKGALIATADNDGAICIWSATTRHRIWRMMDPVGANGVLSRSSVGRAPVNSVAFSPDGKLLLTTSDDGAARIWGVATGRLC